MNAAYVNLIFNVKLAYDHINSVHGKKKYFKCSICESNFQYQTSLNNHIKSVHQRRKHFKCNICESNFECEISLNNHISSVHEVKNQPYLNIITLNVCGSKSHGRIDQVKNLLLKYKVSIAVLTETEVSHEMAKTFNIEGYTVYCPPSFTTGPKGKEAGLIMLVSNDIASSIILRHDLNNEVDTIPTLWVQLKNLNQKLDIIIGGVYRRSRPSTDLMISELK